MHDIFDILDDVGAGRVVLASDPASGLRAMIVLDNMALGPAMGGIRTQAYPSFTDALRDAHRLASAMTLKCAIAGLPAGGGKTVIMAHPGLDRPAAFERLGEIIEDMGGRYRAAGDLGTTASDLAHAARKTRYVNTTGTLLGDLTATTVLNCMRAAAVHRGHETLSGLRVAVQGCGLIGTGVAHGLAREGATVFVADADPARAFALAADIGGSTLPAESVLTAPVDIVSPCAVGGVMTDALVPKIQAWMICGGANNQLADKQVASTLAARSIVFVPDFLASSGAVIYGACQLMVDPDPAPFLAAVGDTTTRILARAAADGLTTVAVAEQIARERIAAA